MNSIQADLDRECSLWCQGVSNSHERKIWCSAHSLWSILFCKDLFAVLRLSEVFGGLVHQHHFVAVFQQVIWFRVTGSSLYMTFELVPVNYNSHKGMTEPSYAEVRLGTPTLKMESWKNIEAIVALSGVLLFIKICLAALELRRRTLTAQDEVFQSLWH